MKDFYFADESAMGGYKSISFKQDGQELLQTEYLDENNKRQVDIVQAKLAEPIVAGQSTEVHIEATIKIPAFFSRGGWQEDLFRFTQWYPKPAVYDVEGWHPMSYLDVGEFYSEYGSYEVTLNVPQNFALVTTGEILSEQETATSKVVKISAEQVPDFAWCCSSSFIRKERQIDINGKIVPMYLFTNFDEGYDEVLTYMEDALKFYSHEVGSYPYAQYSLVLTDNAIRGGMEYPMLSIIDLDYLGQSMDNLVAHEIGHNWFQSALGSNERRYPWIDEGFNSFVERKYNASKYKEPNYNWILPNFYRTDKRD